MTHENVKTIADLVRVAGEEHGERVFLRYEDNDVVKDVTFTGFKYNVSHYDFCMSGDYRTGSSNEFADAEATVDIGQGRFVVIEVSGD